MKSKWALHTKLGDVLARGFHERAPEVVLSYHTYRAFVRLSSLLVKVLFTCPMVASAFAKKRRGFITTHVPGPPTLHLRRGVQSGPQLCIAVQLSTLELRVVGAYFALEPEAEGELDEQPLGLYLFTTGPPDQAEETITSFLEEKRCSKPGVRLHVALYNGDGEDLVPRNLLLRRDSKSNKTANILRTIAHSTGGRFHWIQETGIVESDDVQILLNEIDTMVEYSKQCQELVERGTIGNQWTATRIDEYEMKALAARKTPTSPSDSKENSVQGCSPPVQQQRTSGGSIRFGAQRCTQSMDNNVRRYTTRGSYYRTDQVGSVISSKSNSRNFGQVGKSLTKVSKRPFLSSVKCSIPKAEEAMSTREWLKKYSIRNLGLSLNQLVSGAARLHPVVHDNRLGAQVEARYCAGLFPLVNIAGNLRHLQYTWSELETFKNELRKCLLRYILRLEWLLSGSRRFFGVVVEQCVVIVIDLSGSMEPNVNEMKTCLKQLVWEQLFKQHVAFNLIAFNSEILEWQSRGPRLADEPTCHDAIAWIDQLEAIGSTSTDVALQRAAQQLKTMCPRNTLLAEQHLPLWLTKPEEEENEVDTKGDKPVVKRAIYLITDGKPDKSCASILKSVQEWLDSDNAPPPSPCPRTFETNSGGKRKQQLMKLRGLIPVHVISLASGQESKKFLRKLAQMTQGRYHEVLSQPELGPFIQQLKCTWAARCQDQVDEHDPTTTLATSPKVESDNLQLLLKEMRVAERSIKKLQYFQQMYNELRRTTVQ
ncbi:unnamed protein product [Dicrocoelium dendriticum]|nr:unnamed protein product [Dicrocoelium dendriticum]